VQDCANSQNRNGSGTAHPGDDETSAASAQNGNRHVMSLGREQQQICPGQEEGARLHRALPSCLLRHEESSNGDYELTIPYEDEADLDKTVYDLISEMAMEADDRHCFIETHLYENGTERQW